MYVDGDLLRFYSILLVKDNQDQKNIKSSTSAHYKHRMA